ncbi:helix-turn-helix transcriptional regulator [Saccharibacillus kuerlensis]|uniref:DeoR family transcriptional regulator n=1 Tax=Saccharibacillus kuerlensis TaxID=459527 RepID=A0ABQ2L7Q3_9BACL|nr:YafY family protein [Saccharibacillus kuerlensis]GGO06229.1 DeoR family transcriptional regulator [Saccharibacillus kuerlensis]
MKLERLISIIYKLLNHEVLSASALADEYGVSQRTIYRDIDVLCAAGFPIVSYLGQSGGYSIMDGYKMDKSLLGSYDVNALITVLQGLSTVFEDERAQGTIERLQTISSENCTPTLSVDFESRRADPDALRQLRTGIAAKQIVNFDYVNADSQRTNRQIEPIRLEFKHANWYVYGFCLTRTDYREFRLSRMLNVQLTSDSFPPRDPTSNSRASHAGIDMSQVQDVVVRVHPHALSEALDHFQQADKQFHNDGSLTIRIPVFQPLEAKWLCSILLSFGSGAEVLEPIELRTVVQSQLREALKLYQ